MPLNSQYEVPANSLFGKLANDDLDDKTDLNTTLRVAEEELAKFIETEKGKK